MSIVKQNLSSEIIESAQEEEERKESHELVKTSGPREDVELKEFDQNGFEVQSVLREIRDEVNLLQDVDIRMSSAVEDEPEEEAARREEDVKL